MFSGDSLNFGHGANAHEFQEQVPNTLDENSLDANVRICRHRRNVLSPVRQLRIRQNRLTIGQHNVQRFACERLRTVLREHTHDCVQHNLGLRQIGGCAFDQYISRVQRNLRMVTIDYGRQRQHHIVGIVNHRIHGRITNDGQILFQLRMRRIKVHQLNGGHALRLVERHESNVFGREGSIPKRSTYRIQIVRSDRDQRSLAANVLMEFVLQINETVVGRLRKGDVTQHSTDDMLTNAGARRLDEDALTGGWAAGWFDFAKTRRFAAEKDEQTGDETLQTQQIVSVSRNIDAIDDFLGCSVSGRNVALLFGEQLLFRGLEL